MACDVSRVLRHTFFIMSVQKGISLPALQRRLGHDRLTTAEDQRVILAQACMAIVHLTAGEDGRLLYRTHLGSPADWTPYETVLDTITRLCPDVITAVRGYVATWRARFWQEVGRGIASDVCGGPRLMGEDASTMHVLSAKRARRAFDHVAATDWLYSGH